MAKRGTWSILKGVSGVNWPQTCSSRSQLERIKCSFNVVCHFMSFSRKLSLSMAFVRCSRQTLILYRSTNWATSDRPSVALGSFSWDQLILRAWFHSHPWETHSPRNHAWQNASQSFVNYCSCLSLRRSFLNDLCREFKAAFSMVCLFFFQRQTIERAMPKNVATFQWETSGVSFYIVKNIHFEMNSTCTSCFFSRWIRLFIFFVVFQKNWFNGWMSAPGRAL